MDFTSFRKAVGAGLDKVAGMSPAKKDEDLFYYNRLKPSDFMDLVQRFGEESVMDYIKTMEVRRGKNGNTP